MTAVIFLSSKTNKVMCLTVEMPTATSEYELQRRLQSAMDSAVEIESELALLRLMNWRNTEDNLIPDKLYPLEGYDVEFKDLPAFKMKFAIITKLPGSYSLAL